MLQPAIEFFAGDFQLSLGTVVPFKVGEIMQNSGESLYDCLEYGSGVFEQKKGICKHTCYVGVHHLV